jgi:hypothetical protein
MENDLPASAMPTAKCGCPAINGIFDGAFLAIRAAHLI